MAQLQNVAASADADLPLILFGDGKHPEVRSVLDRAADVRLEYHKGRNRPDLAGFHEVFRMGFTVQEGIPVITVFLQGLLSLTAPGTLWVANNAPTPGQFSRAVLTVVRL